ncbi:MAG TPA: sialate O-acetylesterase [Rhizomicrobium sp.]|jgi:sialate O-acetylesterase|nr:sialate O-acetylesterase [Rhizomicrobium sp.]
MKALIVTIALLAAAPAEAAPLLHPMFADHAVLQRGAPIPVYGAARPGADVQLEIGGQTASAHTDRNGQWRTTLPALPAGGPYTLRAVSGNDSQEVHDVLVGDVFLCTGQSNMQLSVRRAANADFEIAAATDGQVRELAVDRVPSPVALTTFTSPVAWKVETPQTAGDFSASCFYFARELRKHVKVPVGLVTVAWGGTRVRGWVSQPTLHGLGFFNDDLDMLALYQRDPAAASRRWDAAWESWWRAHGKGEPWKEDASSWPVAPAELGAWYSWPGLSLPEGSAEPGVGFVGQMWLSTRVHLTAAQAKQSATLDLGRASEEEKSWVNGQGVGGSSLDPDARHDLPRGLLREGDNTVTLNIFCSWKNCGLSGPASTRAIRFADGSSAMLDQPWHYKPVDTLIAPQIPWGPMHGVGLQYGGMIAPIGPYGVKAAIWYQGESNIYFAQHYQALLATMMSDWRKQFGHDLPFMIVQIPDYGPAPTAPTQSLWSDVREAQRRAVEADAHAALAVTIDIGDPKLLHPANKQEVGRRLSIAARHLVYGEPVAPSGPRVMEAKRNGDAVTVSFRDVTGVLTGTSGQPNAFELCDASSCRWARATLGGDHVTLSDAGNATRVRYCWGDSPICTLSDGSALPAGPFEVSIQ